MLSGLNSPSSGARIQASVPLSKPVSIPASRKERSDAIQKPTFSQNAHAADTEVMKLKTPHSGFHRDSDRDFMEGWYWRVTLPDEGSSFAMMYSYEQRSSINGEKGRVGVQLMGPQDGYIAQTATDLSTFWGDRNELALGACLKPANSRRQGKVPKRPLPATVFHDTIKEGFQATATWHQGSIRDVPGTCPGNLEATVPCAKWAFNVRPVYGWGDSGCPQRSTAHWLSALPVFEPHWQVLMAHGVADGYLQWGDGELSMYHFKDCPVYAEKNWGNGFPKKWAWVQCNSFPGHPYLTVTAACAVRNVLNVPGLEEEVGLIGIHHEGKFYDLGVMSGRMRWSVSQWGKWHMWAKGEEYEALIEATCDEDAGVRLRAPTGDAGLVPACKDTFVGRLRVRLWALDRTSIRKAEPIVDAVSSSAALEVGGGPWWDTWDKEAKLNDLVGLALRAPVDEVIAAVEENSPVSVPSWMQPPGY